MNELFTSWNGAVISFNSYFLIIMMMYYDYDFNICKNGNFGYGRLNYYENFKTLFCNLATLNVCWFKESKTAVMVMFFL